MKKVKILTACIIIVFMMSYTVDRSDVYSSIVATSIDETLDLPDEPYDYSLVLNEALLSSTIDLGYGSGGIDTTILPIINDRVATLGRVLFYDKKLSALENISCGSCHLQSSSFADPKPLSTGVSTPTKRNSMHLNDLGWSNNESFFWDMGKIDINEAIKLPLKDDNEIGANINDVRLKLELTEHYPDLFKQAFGDNEITEDRIVESLSDFILSINSFDSKFDKAIQGEVAFSSLEENGKMIFAESCAMCHSQGGSALLEFIPIDDIQLLSWFQDNSYQSESPDKGATEGMDDLPGLFKMPTLRNVDKTAPYMHDGGIPDLDSLINFYSHGIDENSQAFFIPPGGFGFNDSQKSALKAFLLTLTDESMLTNPKWSDPFSLNTITEDLGIELTIAPNPTTDMAVIKLEGYEGTRKEIIIRDMSGSVVMTDYFMNSEYTIERASLTIGLYIVSVKVEGKFGSYKLIVN